MAKYKNIVELGQGFRDGELDGWKLLVDNDSSHLWYFLPGPESGEDVEEKFEEDKYDEGKELYDGSNDCWKDGDRTLNALGIPHEGV